MTTSIDNGEKVSCLTSPREPRSCVHKKHPVCQMKTYMICNSSQVHHSRFILCICIDVIRQHHICYKVKMNQSSGFSFRFYCVHDLVMNRFLWVIVLCVLQDCFHLCSEHVVALELHSHLEIKTARIDIFTILFDLYCVFYFYSKRPRSLFWEYINWKHNFCCVFCYKKWIISWAVIW